MVPENQASRLLAFACLVMLVIACLGYAMPLHLWGTNFLAYAPLGFGIGAILAGIGLGYGLTWAAPKIGNVKKIPLGVWSLLVAIGMWALFYNLVNQTLLYGDSRNILNNWDKGDFSGHAFKFWKAFSPNIFSSKNGEQFTFNLVSGIQTLLGCGAWGAFRVFTAALGLIYSFVWMQFVLRRFQTLPLRVVGAVIGLTAGITQVFYAHPEVYAAPFLLFTSYLIALVNHLETRSTKWLIASAVLLLLSIRAHSAGFALTPTLLYAGLVQWAGARPERQRWMGWRWAGIGILVTCFMAGLYGYFSVFQAGKERILSDGRGKNIFLTLLPDGTPDNAYAMFSGWHLWDFGQELLLCTLPGIAILLAWILGWRPSQTQQRPAVVGVTLGAVMLAAAYFAFDPVLTMPRDWDLCGLVAAPLLVLTVILLASRENALSTKALPIGLLLTLGLLQLNFVPVNADPDAVHRRLIDISKHAFITQHGGSAFLLIHALDAMDLDSVARSKVAIDAVADLEQHQSDHNRSEYAFLCQYAGSLAFIAQDYENANNMLMFAFQQSPSEFSMYGDLATLELRNGNPEAAMPHARRAVNIHPEYSGNYEVAIQAAVKLGKWEDVVEFGNQYLQKFPQDPRHLAHTIDSVKAVMPPPPSDSVTTE